MDMWIGIVLGGTLAALGVLWRQVVLTRRDVAAIRRELYYTDGRMKSVAADAGEGLQALRTQVARLASGYAVPVDLIRAGRRYLDVSGNDASDWVGRDRGDGLLLIVDVRTPKEYAVKHIKGAKLVPFEELDRRYAAEIPETADKILVYCSSGERSRMACDYLSERGYANVYNLHEGLPGWPGPTEGEGELQFIRLERRP
jgi:rhodanese-related sulfurtransferase